VGVRVSEWLYIHCNRVLRTSNGCTTRVAATPAVNPAVVSIMEGESSVEVVRPSMGGTTRGMVLLQIGC
jgi:hypothetical protein